MCQTEPTGSKINQVLEINYNQDYFELFLVMCSSNSIFSFLIKMSTIKAIEMETVFFHSPGNPRVASLTISLVLKISGIASPTN